MRRDAGRRVCWSTAIAYAVVLWLPIVCVATGAVAGAPGPRGAPDLSRAWGPLLNSLVVAAGATLGAALIAAPLACLIARLPRIWRGGMLSLASVPLAVPPFLVASGWIELLGSSRTISRAVLQVTGLPVGPLLYSRAGAAAILAGCLFPLVLWVLTAALSRVDPALIDDAHTCTSERRAWLAAAAPPSVPALAAGAALVFVLALGEFGVANLLLVNQSASSTHTYPVWVFTDYQVHRDVRRSASLSLPLVAVAAICAGLLRRLWRSASSRDSEGAASYDACASRHRARRRAAAVVAVLLLVVAPPLVGLVARSLGWAKYIRACGSYAEEIRNTVVLAGAAALIGTGLAFMGAVCSERARRGAWLVTPFVLLPCVVPPTVTGIGLIAAYNRPGAELVYDAPAIVVLALLARLLPIAYLVVRGAVASFPASTAEAALTEGATWAQAQRIIVAPAVAPALAASAAIVFVLGAGELPTTLLVSPPGWQSLAVSLNSLLHYGHTAEVAALSVVLIAMTCAVGAAAWRHVERMAA